MLGLRKSKVEKKVAKSFCGISKLLTLVFCMGVFQSPLKAQNFNLNSAIYNCLVGGITGGIGSVINKKKEEKIFKALAKGFVTGTVGGAVMYSGKKLNFLISQKQQLGYAWMSRAVYSAGNSIVENACANRKFWAVWHYDLAFVRFEFNAERKLFTPRFMPSSFGGILFMAFNGRVDGKTSLKSGTLTFRTKEIAYSPTLVGSTASNGFLLNDTLRRGMVYYDVYAHEMNHAFQFQDFSGINYFFNPLSTKWKEKYAWFRKSSKWIYGDLNYEAMLINYFIINRGSRGNFYCHNYLENEAEFLSVGRKACN